MSPTYWTTSQIKMAARANGWEFIKAEAPRGPWGCAKPGRKVMFKSDRRGGLLWVCFTYSVSGRSTVEWLGRDYRGKLRAVLRFLEGLPHLS